jgi:hypothetical protein
LTSRTVALTAAFLALAAGGTAACDAPSDTTGWTDGPDGSTTVVDNTTYDGGSYDSDSYDGDTTSGEESLPEETGDEVFYCADVDAQIVDEQHCADDPDGSAYLFWHSSGYPRGLSRGTVLDGGDSFASGDREARRAFKLPATGKVPNGTVKTNVVGRNGGGSGLSGDSAGG